MSEVSVIPNTLEVFLWAAMSFKVAYYGEFVNK